MRKSPLLLIGTFLLLSLLLPTQTILAAPNTPGEDQTIQIVLVLDVSGSMSTPVYTGIVPEDLLSLLLRLNELNQDAEYIDLQDQLEEADNNPAVLEANEAYHQAFEDIRVDVSSHHVIYGDIDESERFNWGKKIEIAAKNSGYDFNEFDNGYEGFKELSREFFNNPRRFTYSPIVCCRGRRPK